MSKRMNDSNEYNTIQYTIHYTIQYTIHYTIQYTTQYITIKNEYYYSGINPVEFRGHSKRFIIIIIVKN